ncbi:MAG TPA: glycosyltransferase [Gemmatimonadota bacterium]|nr:glycosyltransferase [Gemmatimonadota bacterium]
MNDLTTGDRPVARDLTVVIPTLGREILRESLAALSGGSELPARVIVVHQGDDPEVGRWVREAPGGLTVEYVQSDRRGRATGVNTGIARVETRFVALTDDDCLVDAEWTRRMAAHLRDHPDRLVTGRVDAAGDATPVAVVTSDKPDMQRRPRIWYDLLSGGNMGGAVDVLQRIGPLDEDPCLATAEDGEYAYRALRAGVPITYDPTIVVDHVGWRDEGQRESQYRSYARSRAGFLGKYLRQGDVFIALRTVVGLLRALKRWAIGLIRRDPDQAARGRAYVTELLPGLITGWRSRS